MHIQTSEGKTEYLNELVNSYLLKDILAFDTIRNSDKILSLLRMLAFQCGSEVSLQELGKRLSMSKNTVEKYLDLLTKVFVIHKLEGFSRNLNKEITKSSKWYFYDNGIRNILVANLNPIELRSDIGVLWENYVISERIKKQSYEGMVVQNYFWRTYDQQEIDWIENRSGKLFATEFTWNPNKSKKVPVAWKNAYEQSEFNVINNDNYLDWVRYEV
jgi:predicted AAA+ superfamily ATPase